MSSSVDDVVDVYNHALYSKKPKTRYPIGGDAKLQAFVAKFFSDRMRDKMILNKLKKLKNKLNTNQMI